MAATASYGQYNTHGVQEQLKLLQGLGSLLRHQISIIHNKGHCSLANSLNSLVNCSTHTYLWPVSTNINEWWPWLQLQTNWRDSGYERFTLGLETNCVLKATWEEPAWSRLSYNIKSYNRNPADLTTKHLWGSHLLPSRAWKVPWQRSCSDLAHVDVPRIVSEIIWASCLAGVLCKSVKIYL